MKALSDENRLRVVCALGDRELCVCQITAMLRLSPSTVSKHMSVLHQAGLVEGRKKGRWMYYRVARKMASAVARAALGWVQRALAGSARAIEDAKRLKVILMMRPEVLCRRQHAACAGEKASPRRPRKPGSMRKAT
jgi:DNA-binding transcriptional ArsR family regulator